MEKGHTFETVVGILVLIISVGFFHYVYSRSSWQSVDGYTLSAKFDLAEGITEGTDVKISGIRVGKIVSTAVDPITFKAIVKFTLSKDLKLPQDTSATVASEGLFGGKYLSLTPGGEEDTLEPNDEILDTTGAMNLESLISKFMFSQEKK